MVIYSYMGQRIEENVWSLCLKTDTTTAHLFDSFDDNDFFFQNGDNQLYDGKKIPEKQIFWKCVVVCNVVNPDMLLPDSQFSPLDYHF
jgi:hypothetical protein